MATNSKSNEQIFRSRPSNFTENKSKSPALRGMILFIVFFVQRRLHRSLRGLHERRRLRRLLSGLSVRFLYHGGCIGPSEAYTNGGGCVGSSWA